MKKFLIEFRGLVGVTVWLITGFLIHWLFNSYIGFGIVGWILGIGVNVELKKLEEKEKQVKEGA